MKQKSVLMLVIAFFVVLATASNMTMLQDNVEVTAEPGDVIDIPVRYEYTSSDWFGSPGTVRLIADADMDDFPSGPEDKVMAKTSIWESTLWDTSYTYQLPSDMDPGTYEIDVETEILHDDRATGDGGYQLVVNVQDDSGSGSDTDPSYIVVSSGPDGSQIEIDGVKKGTTPGEIEVQPGEHSVQVTHDGYNSFSTTVDVSSGERETISKDLEEIEEDEPDPTPSPAVSERFEVDVGPYGADVFLNNEKIGTTPLEKDIEVTSENKSCTLVVKEDGFQDVTKTFDLENGETYELTGNLPVQNGDPVHLGGDNAFVDFIQYILSLLGVDLS